jgi:hypothetical protein
MLQSGLKAFGIIKDHTTFYRSSLVQEIYLEQLCIELISHAELLTPILRDLVLGDETKFDVDCLKKVEGIMVTIDQNYNVLKEEGDSELLKMAQELIKEIYKGVQIINQFLKQNKLDQNYLTDSFTTLNNRINKALIYFDFTEEV